MANQLAASITLKPFRTTGHGGKYVVRIHGAQDQVSSSPGFKAVPAHDSVAGPTLQASHANRRQKAGLALALDLDACF